MKLKKSGRSNSSLEGIMKEKLGEKLKEKLKDECQRNSPLLG